MKSLWLLTIKNLKVLLRDKGSALIVIFAPLLIILILGLSYNNSGLYNIKIGVVAPSQSPDVQSFISLLQEQKFTLNNYDSDIDQCLQDIRTGLVHACINLPESLQIESNSPKEVVFYVDPTRINLVWMIQETVNSKFDLKAKEISQGLADQVLGTLSTVKTDLQGRVQDVSGIQSSASSASSLASSARENLNNIDVTLDELPVNSEVIKTLESSVLAALDKVNQAREDLAALNLSSSQEEQVDGPLGSAKSNLETVLPLVSDNSTDSLSYNFFLLQKNVQKSKEKLLAAKATIENSDSSLESTQTTLQQTVDSLTALQNAMNQISSNIDQLKVTDSNTIAQPLTTKIETVREEGTYLNYLFPTLLIIVIMFSSLLLGTTLVMMEKNSSAYIRNFFIPVRKATFIAATYLTSLFLNLVQIIIILGISLIFLKDSLPIFPSVALILFITASVFTFLGMALGYLFSSEDTGVLASISLGSLLLFTSGVIIPLEAIAPALRDIINFSPFVIAEGMIREIFLFSSTISDVYIDFLVLLSYAIVLFLLVLIIEVVLHKHLIKRAMQQHHLKKQGKKTVKK